MRWRLDVMADVPICSNAYAKHTLTEDSHGISTPTLARPTRKWSLFLSQKVSVFRSYHKRATCTSSPAGLNAVADDFRPDGKEFFQGCTFGWM
ncbi:hypothetical protein N7468_004252 [Penicillium chermesinum]|uniref:Uncharacterized protein n=1 Tax=Penicillium chermesinum TaxID=63820 RepID=A0A9W9TT06_9EURO|nr:uncharacterized protein N7468_004252 [Penicillium chermesinum]KAJ5239633.1 hypothetical protein N7468_004252 [Penicillium chermesinum]